MPTALPIIHGTSAALYPFSLTISFRTIVGRFQNGSEQRSVALPAGLAQFEIPYSRLTRTQKNTILSAVTAAKGSFDNTLTMTLGSLTYSNLHLDSDAFAATENKPTIYDAPLKLSQSIPQNFSPGTAGTSFPSLANGAMTILPYTQRRVFQTVAASSLAGTRFSTPEFAGGISGYPSSGLMGWTLAERMLSDADAATRLAHFVANWGRAFSFPFTDEDGTTYSHANGNGSPHYSSDSLTFHYNGPNDTDVMIGIELTNN